MRSNVTALRRTTFAVVVSVSLLFWGWRVDEPAATQVAAAAPAPQVSIPSTLDATDETWTPEAMEDLLAPVALYPDKILGQLLVVATNPQEVLDAGNWRLKNEGLSGADLEDAARQAGFTPPARMLLQNPVVLDMMCSQFGWTKELGQAYVNDQEGLLDAVQRLRFQARDAGNLSTSDRMVVDTRTVNGHEAIYLNSPDPNVVYVPQYDPQTVYASHAVEEHHDDGHSTATLITTGLLAFGAGLLVSSLFHHDDHHDYDDDHDDWYHDNYYAPQYYGPPMPYYPPYPYRPVYGGYYPSTAYVRPPAYPYAYDNTTVVRNVNNYWGRYDERSYTRRDARPVRSPITLARPNRPELGRLNAEAKRGPKRRGPDKAQRDVFEASKPGVRNRGAASAGAPGRTKAGQTEPSGSGVRNRAQREDRAPRTKPTAGAGGEIPTATGVGGVEVPKAGGGRRARPNAAGGGGRETPTAVGAGGGEAPKAGAGGGGRRARSNAGGGAGGTQPKAGTGAGTRPRAGGGGTRPNAGGAGGGGTQPKAGGGGAGRKRAGEAQGGGSKAGGKKGSGRQGGKPRGTKKPVQ